MKIVRQVRFEPACRTVARLQGVTTVMTIRFQLVKADGWTATIAELFLLIRSVLGLFDPRYGSKDFGGRAIPVLVPSYVTRLYNVLKGVQPASRKLKGAPGYGLPPIPRDDSCGIAHKPWQSKNTHVEGKTMVVPEKQASVIMPNARGLLEPQCLRASNRFYGDRDHHCNRPCWSGSMHHVKGQSDSQGVI